MYYEDMDPDLKSQFIKSQKSLANLVSESQMPVYGLNANELLDTKQLAALKMVRNKKLKSDQRKRFI